MVQSNGKPWRALHGSMLGLLFAATGLSVLAGGCLAGSNRISCDDVLPPGQFSYTDLQNLILEQDDKGCAANGCHGGKKPEQGLRLDSPTVIYDELTTRTDLIYAMLASKQMPAGDENGWDENDLRLLRSWYCAGAFPP